MSTVKLSEKAVGSIVKLREDGVAAEFVIVHQGLPSSDYDASCRGTWLFRRNIHSERIWYSENVSDYEKSDINAWLNDDAGGYLASLDAEIRDGIKSVKIPYRKGYGKYSTLKTKADGLPVRVFLISDTELGYVKDYSGSGMPSVGAKLDYFEADTTDSAHAMRIGYLEGVRASYFTRDPNILYQSNVFQCTTSGKYNCRDANDPHGIRQLMIMPDTALVDSNDFVTFQSAGTTVAIDGVERELEMYCAVDGIVRPINGVAAVDGVGREIF